MSPSGKNFPTLLQFATVHLGVLSCPTHILNAATKSLFVAKRYELLKMDYKIYLSFANHSLSLWPKRKKAHVFGLRVSCFAEKKNENMGYGNTNNKAGYEDRGERRWEENWQKIKSHARPCQMRRKQDCGCAKNCTCWHQVNEVGIPRSCFIPSLFSHLPTNCHIPLTSDLYNSRLKKKSKNALSIGRLVIWVLQSWWSENKILCRGERLR